MVGDYVGQVGGHQANADVALPGHDDGAVDGGHEGHVHGREEGGGGSRQTDTLEPGPQERQAVQQRAEHHHLITEAERENGISLLISPSILQKQRKDDRSPISCHR